MWHVSFACDKDVSFAFMRHATCDKDAFKDMPHDSCTWLTRDTAHGEVTWGDVRWRAMTWGDVTAWYVTWLNDINRIGSAGRACLVPRSAQTTGINLLISLFAGGRQQVGAGQKASQGIVCATRQGRAKRVDFIKRALYVMTRTVGLIKCNVT